MSIPFDTVKLYPWLPISEDLFPSYTNKNPYDFISDCFNKISSDLIVEIIFEFFSTAFENREDFPKYKIIKDNNFTMEFYLVIKIILYLFNNKRILNLIANLYSSVINDDLLQRTKRDITNLEVILQILNIDYKKYDIPAKFKKIVRKELVSELETNFVINFIDYLRYSSKLRDEYRRLVNNCILDGYVYIENRTIIRLIKEYIRSRFIYSESENVVNIENLKNKLFGISEFKILYQSIESQWDLKREKLDFSIEVVFDEEFDISMNFPPCITEIRKKAGEAQNLTHQERLTLLFFLHALEYPNDQIINIFSTLPDFNRDKTKYQVEHAKKKGYTPHSCKTLKSLNLCMASKYKDELCLKGYYSKKQAKQKNITHPLFYINFKQYLLSLNQKSGTNIKNKKNER